MECGGFLILCPFNLNILLSPMLKREKEGNTTILLVNTGPQWTQEGRHTFSFPHGSVPRPIYPSHLVQFLCLMSAFLVSLAKSKAIYSSI